jgi:LmbE family N-acetylglucosaminyl deacetylase
VPPASTTSSTATPHDGPVPGRVLAVYAHPDDPEVSSAGTLAGWAAAGAEVHLVICALGEKGTTDPSVDPVELAGVRAGEAAAAAAVLGIASHENLGRPDGEIVNDLDLRRDLVSRVRSLRPDVVVGPDPTPLFFGSTYVNHVDHRELGLALLDACTPAAASPLYFPEAGPAHRVTAIYLSGTLEPNTHVDISDTLERKIEALLCHASQIADPAEVAEAVRRRAGTAGAVAGLAAAETFRVLRPR